MIDAKVINAISEVISKGGIAEVKLESGKVVVVELGKRKIVYKTSRE